MSMKTRQTFTIAPEVSARAKRYARTKGISLSSLVEDLLRKTVDASHTARRPAAGTASFSRRWRGKGALADRDDPRSRKLHRKYGL